MRIDRVEIYVTDLPTRVRRRVSTGSRDTGGSDTLLGKPLLVRISAGDVTGYGQVRPISPGHSLPDSIFSAVAAIRDFYGPALIGRRVAALSDLEMELDRRLPSNANARAAIDHALHDAIGKSLSVPVSDLLGGAARSKLPLEWSVSLADEAGPMIEECARAKELYGINAYCLKAGSPAGWRTDARIVREVRGALGPLADISIDPNTVWSVADTIRAIKAMQDCDLDYVEQPIDRADLSGLALIRQNAGGIPIMADESVISPQSAYALARANAADALCVKLYKVGGLRSALKIAAIAEAANLRVNLGGTAIMSQLEVAAGVHFYACVPEYLAFGGAEFVFGLGVAGDDPLVDEPAYSITDGSVVIPPAIGLGVEINETKLQALALHRETIRA